MRASATTKVGFFPSFEPYVLLPSSPAKKKNTYNIHINRNHICQGNTAEQTRYVFFFKWSLQSKKKKKRKVKITKNMFLNTFNLFQQIKKRCYNVKLEKNVIFFFKIIRIKKIIMAHFVPKGGRGSWPNPKICCMWIRDMREGDKSNTNLSH